MEVDGKILHCPLCKSEHINKHGIRVTRRGRKQEYVCKGCGHPFVPGSERRHKGMWHVYKHEEGNNGQ